MANHVSAVKRYRQSQKRRAINGMNRQKLKTQVKKLRAAIQAGNAPEAQALLGATFSVIDRSVQKGVIQANAARRYKSRMNRHVNALATPA
jgi:small subunit ribosomal protein S20